MVYTKWLYTRSGARNWAEVTTLLYAHCGAVALLGSAHRKKMLAKLNVEKWIKDCLYSLRWIYCTI